MDGRVGSGVYPPLGCFPQNKNAETGYGQLNKGGQQARQDHNNGGNAR